MPRPDRERGKVSEFQNTTKVTINYQPQKKQIYDFFRNIFGNDKSVIFPERLLQELEITWDTTITPVLIEEFGRGSILYVIFYRSREPEEIIMEIWDSRYVDKKASQVFKLRGITESEMKYFSKDRNQAKKFTLENWS